MLLDLKGAKKCKHWKEFSKHKDHDPIEKYISPLLLRGSWTRSFRVFQRKIVNEEKIVHDTRLSALIRQYSRDWDIVRDTVQ